MERLENIKVKEKNLFEDFNGNLFENIEKKLDFVNNNFNSAEKFSKLIVSKSNTKTLVELRSKFNERIQDLQINISKIKKKIEDI